MAGLDGAAAELRGLIPAGAFIRRDRKRRALFVSDFPVRVSGGEVLGTARRLEGAGWQADLREGLALLDWPLEGYRRFFASLPQTEGPAPWPLSGLCKLLEKHPAPLDGEMLMEARLALLLWDGGKTEALSRLAGESLAVRLRRREPVPPFYLLLLRDCPEKEDRGC